MASANERMNHVCVKYVRTENKSIPCFCPLPSLTAYWTPPPSWPKRFLCENKLFPFSFSRMGWILLASIWLIYFLVMDIVLFAYFHTTNVADSSRVANSGELYSPFTHLTIKAILSDHLRHYIFTPSSEYFNYLTGFTEKFSFISPNMVSATHLFVAFVAGKFIASENLVERRIGVWLYFVRTWLDSFDGIVYRAHSGRYLQYNSVYSTFGYFIDACFDTLGGFFLSFGILFYLFKRFGPSQVQTPKIPVWTKNGISSSPEISLMSNNHGAVSKKETYSYQYLFLKTLSYGVCLGVAGIFWDRVVKGFSEVFQTELKDSSLSMLQFKLSHSHTTVFLFFLWRFISGQTLLTYAQIAIYMDKIWEFLKYTPWILLTFTIVLYAITLLYIKHIRAQLELK